jgi:hypothetical protein
MVQKPENYLTNYIIIQSTAINTCTEYFNIKITLPSTYELVNKDCFFRSINQLILLMETPYKIWRQENDMMISGLKMEASHFS